MKLSIKSAAMRMVPAAVLAVASFCGTLTTGSASAAAPTITAISVSSVTTPSAAFTFTVTGTNFVQATRRVRGTYVATEEYGSVNATYNSATQLTVSVPTLEAVTSAVTLHFYVSTPGQGRSVAAADQVFTINPPVQGPPPTIAALSTTSVTTPTAAFTFTVSGTNFVAGTTALPFHSEVVSDEWGELKTTVNSATQVTVSMRALPKVKTATTLHLYVENPDGTRSDVASELTFTINPPAPGTPPTLTALSAIGVTTPARNVTFTVTGTGFVTGKGWNNQTTVASEEYGPLDTQVNSATGLTVYLGTFRKVRTPITLHLYVLNPDGTRSDASTDIVFTIN